MRRHADPAAHRALNAQRVFESACGEQSRASALALDERIGCRRRAVREVLQLSDQLAGGQTERARRQFHRIEHATGAIVRRGQRLEDAHVTVIGEQDQIGERATDVSADISHESPLSNEPRGGWYRDRPSAMDCRIGRPGIDCRGLSINDAYTAAELDPDPWTPAFRPGNYCILSKLRAAAACSRRPSDST